MNRTIDVWHSPNLGRDMEIAAYGHDGFPLLLFPTAAADFLEYERFLLIYAIQEFIDAGKVRAFSINSINQRSWLNPQVHPRDKALRQVEYNAYIVDEVVPYIREHCNGRTDIVTAGASLGAFHCANQIFRRPDVFEGMIAMSGTFDIRSYYRSDYYDDNIYFNNPVDYLPNLNDDVYLPLLRKKQHLHIVTGQGAWEDPNASRRLSGILWQKQIPHELDLWGYDMPHDWPTWRMMMVYYLQAKF